MRAREFMTEAEARRPAISLRHLNQLKHEGRTRAASHARHDRLVRAMYARPVKRARVLESRR